MPELPEVQNFANALNEMYAGKKILKITFQRENLRYPFQTHKLKNIFKKGNIFECCDREGKHLVLKTNVGEVFVSLGMTGAFKPAIHGQMEKHEHVTIEFESGELLAYVDPRRFGYWLVPDCNWNAPVQCDALNCKDLNKLFLSDSVQQKKCSIKDFLMNQKYIGGIGNIYALEVLFRVGILPTKTCESLSKSNWEQLASEIPTLLNLAIELGGSSVATYRTLNGKKGSFQTLHMVYGRENQKCLKVKCTGIIVRVVQGGRSSWFCPVCQK